MKKFTTLFILLCFFTLDLFSLERIKISGTSYEMGKAWAKKQATTIKALNSQFNIMAAFALKQPPQQVSAKAQKIAKHMAKEDLEELRGIADGAGLKFEEVLVYNLFYTLCVSKIGCRQFVAWGNKTDDGKLVHARNLDWIDYPGSPMKRFNTVVNFKGKDKKEYLSLTWPGFSSVLTGANNAGITIAFNQLPQKGDTTYLSEPTFYTIKRALRTASTLQEVIDIFKKTKPMDSGSVMVSDSKAMKAVVIEIIRGKVGLRKPQGNMISNANHPTAESGVAKAGENGNPEWPVCATAKAFSKKLSTKNVQNLMAHSNVLQPDLNILSVVFEYSDNRMWLSCGKKSAAKGPFVELKLFSDE